MPSQSLHRWQAVSSCIEERLEQKGWLQADLVRESGLSAEVVRPVMKGIAGNYRAGTLAKIAKALGWTGDSIRRVLDGLDPVVDAELGVAELHERLRAIEETARAQGDAIARLEQLLAARVDEGAP